MNKVCRSLCLLSAVLVLLSIHSLAHAFNLPDTGQTLCYDSDGNVIACDTAGYTGQDGAYDIDSISYTDSYTDNGNGTVRDNNTGLMWQKCSAGQTNFTNCSGGTAATYNWYQATGTPDSTYNPSGGTNVCGALNTASFGGYNDWRLPTEQELQTIVDYSIPFPGPTIKEAYFPNTSASYGGSYYWSSTTYAGSPSSAWYVDFSNGYLDYESNGSTYYVRCVRGGQPAQGFTNNTNTVTDNKTGLVWQQDEPGAKTWVDALSYCEGLSLGNHEDWRLPNAKELMSLTDDSRYNPAIDTTYFPNAFAYKYWSSTTDTDGPSLAWYVYFYVGNLNHYDKDGTCYVRCVRGGQSGSLDNFVRLMQGDTIVNTYNNIQDAYNNAQAGDVIQAKNVTSTENQTFVAAKAVSFKGGYDSGFASNSGFTTINGNMTIIGGTVTIEKIIIK